MSVSNSKLWRSIIVSLALSLVAGIFAFIFFSLRSSNSFSKTKVYIKTLNANYNVKEDGSMDVVETWETVFNDSNLSTGSKMFGIQQHGEEYELKSVRDLTNNKTYIFDKSADKNDKGYCTQIIRDGHTYFEWYDNFGDETRTFEITYTVKNAVRLYNDMAELYWQFVGSDFELSVDSAVCTVTLPESAMSQDNKIFGHLERHISGNTNAQFDSDGRAVFTVEKLPSKTYAELRLLMKRNGFSGGYIINADGYDNAIMEEAQWANDTSAIVENNFTWAVADIAICVAVVLISAGVCIYLRFKYRPFKVNFMSDYYREPPENISPGVMSRLYFFYDRTLVQNGIMTATVLSLCNKRHIRLEELKKDILIKFDGASDAEPLTDDELCIYRIFEQAAAGSGEISLKQVNK